MTMGYTEEQVLFARPLPCLSNLTSSVGVKVIIIGFYFCAEE
jgi:hypothetical protein